MLNILNHLGGSWYCRTCIKACTRKSEFLSTVLHSMPKIVDYMEQKYPTISTTPIPFILMIHHPVFTMINLNNGM